jgi:2-polyprenyl-3-methyl-5-hydroxy-6-metoxy-1,4-benzoquinol methylase
MMPTIIWDFWASRYQGLWAQQFALKPARGMVIAHIAESAPESLHILDIGCGVGQLAIELATNFPSSSITAVDSCKGMIDVAKMQNAHTKINYLHSNIEDMPKDKPFDVIIMTHAFPYFPDKLSALSLMHDMLRPGGRLIMVHATTENAYDMLLLVFVRFTVSKAQYLSACRLSSMISDSGFLIGKVQPMKRRVLIPSIYMLEGIRSQ